MRALILSIMLALPAAAQDRAGNNTPGEWVVTHHQPFGLWDSMCDERRTGEVLEERCYLRYVEVFSPRPNFAAMFVFVQHGGTVEFGFEQGTVFKPDGLRAETGGAPVWTMPHRPCLFGGTCRFEGLEAESLLQALTRAEALVFDFIDRHGAPHLISWDLTRFGTALADFRSETVARGL